MCRHLIFSFMIYKKIINFFFFYLNNVIIILVNGMLEFNNCKINYVLYGEGEKDTIVLLHGWGQNIDMMKPIGDPLSNNHKILIIDLPGFGLSSEPTYPWSLNDYVEAIHELVFRLNLKDIIIMGHSFGGKLALLYASKYEVVKVVVFASPINHNVKISTKTKILKNLKKLPGMGRLSEIAKKYIGSTDYKKASPLMREILVNHINTDIYNELSKIKVPTLIVWGTNDMAVDISVAYEIEKAIKGSGVVVYEGCSHYAYLERLNQTTNVLKSFLGDD